MTRLLLCVLLCLGFALLYRQERPAAEEPVEQPTPAVVSPDKDALPAPDPLAFLHKCLERYDAEVKTYRVVMHKQERVGGVVQPREVVDVCFREQPFSVLMKWKVGARKAAAALYVQGENDEQILVRPSGFLSLVGVVKRALDAPDVKNSGRYGIEQFGLKKGLERVLASWGRAQQRGTLQARYEGIYLVPETGGRRCYKVHRTVVGQPEDDGVADVVLYLDVENWLQVGSVLRGPDNRLVGEYFFRDLQLNCAFAADQFTAAAVKR